MWFSTRLFLLALIPAAVLRAQEPTPSPTPEATPAPSASPSPTAAPASDAPAESTPAPDATAPAAEATPAPEATPAATPAEDVIPIENAPQTAPVDGGAPLDTQDIAPALPDAAYTDPNAIISDEPPAPPSLPAAVENLQQKERLTNIRYKEVRVQADKDPKVANLFEQSEKASSPESKRAALREYYRLLFARMVAIDKSLEAKCAQMEAAYLRRLAQERIEPTIPLNPPPTPEPLGN